MFNKRFMNKLLTLYDKINDLEVENSQLRQTINFKNREITQLEKGSDLMNQDKLIIIRQQKHIEDLKAELTYWKETTDYYQNECLEMENKLSDLNFALSTCKEKLTYWKKVAFEFECHNKHLK